MKLHQLCILGAVVACSVAQGRKIDAARVENIQACKTSEADLLAWFGEPYQRGNQSGFPTMNWQHASAGGGGSETQSLVVYLNADRKVIEYQLNPAAALTTVKDKCKESDPSKKAESAKGADAR